MCAVVSKTPQKLDNHSVFEILCAALCRYYTERLSINVTEMDLNVMGSGYFAGFSIPASYYT